MPRKRTSRDQIRTKMADKMTARDKNIQQFLEGVEDQQSTGIGEKGKALDFVHNEFVKKFIRDNSQDKLANDDDLDPINWNYAAKRLLEICSSQLDRGGMVARYECQDLKMGNVFNMNVIQILNYDYRSYKGTTVHIADGFIRLANSWHKQESQHPVTDVSENITIFVGPMISADCNSSSNLYILLNNSDEMESLKSRLRRFHCFQEHPVKWGDVSEDVRTRLSTNLCAQLQSQPVQVNTDFLQNLEGLQLNQLLQNGTLQICPKQLEFDDNLYVPRWFSTLTTMKTDLDENTTYVVFNAEENDIPKLAKQIKGHVFFIEDIEDLSYLPVYRQIAVTQDIDLNAAIKHLRSLRDAEQHTTPHKIQLLKFDRQPIFRVICDDELLQQNSRLVVIEGPTGEGKTFVLQHIYNKCSTPVCHFTGNQLVSKFSSSSIDDFTVENVREVIINKLATTKFDRVVLEPIFDNLQIVVLVDTANLDRDTGLHDIVKVMVKVPNLSIILSTRDISTSQGMRSLHDSYISLQLLCLSQNDKVDVIYKRSQPLFTSLHARNIFNNWEFKFAKMPTRIWASVADVYKEHLERNHDSFIPLPTPLKITEAEIYEKFVESSYHSIVGNNPESAAKFRNYQQAQIFDAMSKLIPKFLYTAELVIDQKYAGDLKNIDDPSFENYLIDLFSFHAVSGKMQSESSKFVEQFTEFFIHRYVRSIEPPNHFNDILGYSKLSPFITFNMKQFDVVKLVLLCKRRANVSRMLFDSFLRATEKDEFNRWCNNEALVKVNIAGLLRFLNMKPQTNLSGIDILIILSAHVGFNDLFRFLIHNNPEKVSMRDIKIRERQSFRSLLHLVTYHSRDNDQKTIREKFLIIDFLLQVKPKLVESRDLFGNTPLLEQNIHFDLVKYVVEKGAMPYRAILEDTDFTGRNLLDKNQDNPYLISAIMSEYPLVYDRLFIGSLAKPKEPVPVKIDMNEKPVYGEVTLDQIKTVLGGTDTMSDVNITLNQVAGYIYASLKYDPNEDHFQNFLLKDILATNRMAFKHSDLVNLVNAYLRRYGSQVDFQISRDNHDLMCQRDSPFIVACINGYKNISILLGSSFCSEWLENLTDFELSHFFQALEKYHADELLPIVVSKLQQCKYAIPCYPVQESLAHGNLNLFQIYSKKLKFTQSRWPEFEKKTGYGLLHHVIENSMHDSKQVLEQKETLINYIISIDPKSINKSDKLGRCVLLLSRAHYQLIRHLIESTKIKIKTTCHKRRNVLNYCLGNIIRYSEYLGESAYDVNFCKHDQVIYLAKRVGVNNLANTQIQWIMHRSQKLVKIKTKALLAAEFSFEVDNTVSGNQQRQETTNDHQSIMCYTPDSEDEIKIEASWQELMPTELKQRRKIFDSESSSDSVLETGHGKKFQGTIGFGKKLPIKRAFELHAADITQNRAALRRKRKLHSHPSSDSDVDLSDELFNFDDDFCVSDGDLEMLSNDSSSTVQTKRLLDKNAPKALPKIKITSSRAQARLKTDSKGGREEIPSVQPEMAGPSSSVGIIAHRADKANRKNIQKLKKEAVQKRLPEPQQSLSDKDDADFRQRVEADNVATPAEEHTGQQKQ